MSARLRGTALLTLLAGLVAAVIATVAPAADTDAGPVAVSQTVTSETAPDRGLAPAAPVSAARLERIAKRLEARREATSEASVGGEVIGGAGGPVGVELLPQGRTNSRATSVTRNRKNTVASSVASTLAEPAAANDAAGASAQVFYGGNTYHSQSTNRGQTWTQTAIPGGPADAPIACCDLDAVHHSGLDTTFHSVLYINNAADNGVLRIFVRQGNISDGADCSYTLDVGGTGTLLPDYPHIAVSNGFFYISSNNLTPTSWTGAQVRRLDASEMAGCVTATTNTFTYTGSVGQRILTPVEGATTTMYFGSNESANQFRVFRWPESTTTVSQFLRTLPAASNFVNPDCRGGTGNFDFIERSTSWSIAGFRMRGAVVPGDRVWWLWNVGADGSHPQAHLHSAIVTDAANPVRLASPAVFNNGRCFGYPSIGANSTGEFGLSFAQGGQAGGGGLAAQGSVTVDDSSTGVNRFAPFRTTAVGTHNRSDDRFGDYFTIRENERCPAIGWVATNFALLNGNTTSAHVNSRYVEFQSDTHAACP